MTRLFWTVACLGLFVPISTHAAPSISIHVRPMPLNSGITSCDQLPTDVPCSELMTEGFMGGVRTDYFIYLIAEETDPGINGASFGIAYDPWIPRGLDWMNYCSFGDAALVETPGPFGSWPNAWSGLRLVWGPCQQGTVAGHEDEGMRTILCALEAYVYSADILYVTPHPQDGEASMSHCDGTRIVLPDSAQGRAGFGGLTGFNPCTGAGTWTPLPAVPPPQPPYVPPPPPPVPDLSPPAVLLHVSSTVDPADSCGLPFNGNNVVTAGSLTPGDNPHVVYLLAVPQGATESNTYGITGVQLGIQYPEKSQGHPGMKVLGWHTCSDLEFPGDTWPNPGGSNTITWSIDNCQLGDLIPVGYFTVAAYDPSAMSIIPFPPSGFVKVATCKGAEVVVEEHVAPERTGWVSLGGGAIGADTNGCNPLLEPCSGVTPVRVATWGRIKALYNEPH